MTHFQTVVQIKLSNGFSLESNHNLSYDSWLAHFRTYQFMLSLVQTLAMMQHLTG